MPWDGAAVGMQFGMPWDGAAVGMPWDGAAVGMPWDGAAVGMRLDGGMEQRLGCRGMVRGRGGYSSGYGHGAPTPGGCARCVRTCRGTEQQLEDLEVVRDGGR